MRRKLTPTLLLLASLTFGGCASGLLAPVEFYKPSSADEAAADYGEYPSNYQEIIKNYMRSVLHDPYSAVWQFSVQPYKGHTVAKTRESTVFCYTVLANVNAKNLYGGYAGDQIIIFHIRNGKVIEHL